MEFRNIKFTAASQTSLSCRDVDDLDPQLDSLVVLKVPSRRNKVWLFIVFITH